jgi:hypothetical protein
VRKVVYATRAPSGENATPSTDAATLATTRSSPQSLFITCTVVFAGSDATYAMRAPPGARMGAPRRAPCAHSGLGFLPALSTTKTSGVVPSTPIKRMRSDDPDRRTNQATAPATARAPTPIAPINPTRLTRSSYARWNASTAVAQPLNFRGGVNYYDFLI